MASGVAAGMAVGCWAVARGVKKNALRMMDETTASKFIFISHPYISLRVRDCPRATGLNAAGNDASRCRSEKKRYTSARLELHGSDVSELYFGTASHPLAYIDWKDTLAGQPWVSPLNFSHPGYLWAVLVKEGCQSAANVSVTHP